MTDLSVAEHIGDKDMMLDGTNVMFHRERVEAWARGERVAPIFMDVATTRRCQAACIAGDELVAMEDGTAKRMRYVEAGDIVLSANFDGIAKSEVVASRRTKESADTILVVIGVSSRELRCTADHKVLTTNGWIAAGELTTTHQVMCFDGDSYHAECVVAVYDDGQREVFDLECHPHHNFIASGVVVHNCHFCYAQAQNSEGGTITRDHWMSFLEDAAEIGVLAMNYISDGESTMVPWYADAVERATDLGIRIGAGTNGIALSHEVLERILPRLMSLRVNFSAGEKKRYSEIMGLKQSVFDLVIGNIRNAVRLVRDNGWPCIVNMNLVCDPRDADQLLPFARLCKDLGVHYGIIKHCAVDTDGVLDVDYTAYGQIEDVLQEAESLSDDTTKIVIKWNKIRKAGKREHTACYGPPFALQMSGNGLIAPCGPLFNEKYKAFHIGNITTQRFGDIFHSERYWEVMRYLASDNFNPQKRCPSDCMQRLTNDFLFKYREGEVTLPITPPPANVDFLA